jgi:hypothetical protein
VKHLDQKYFSYRREKVAMAVARYPERATILLASEYLRLAFVGIGALLFAAIFGILAWTSVARVGPTDWRVATFAILTFAPAAIVARVCWAFLGARRRASLKDC